MTEAKYLAHKQYQKYIIFTIFLHSLRIYCVLSISPDYLGWIICWEWQMSSSRRKNIY